MNHKNHDINLRPGGGLFCPPPPRSFFANDSETGKNNVTNFGIGFHCLILHLLQFSELDKATSTYSLHISDVISVSRYICYMLSRD